MDNLNVSTCIALGAVLPAVDAVMVAARLYVKFTRRRRRPGLFYGFTLDDFFIVFALAVTIAIGVIFIIGTQIAGFGHHEPQATAGAALAESNPQLTKTKRLAELTNFLAPWMEGAPKLSILFLYRGIFRGTFFNIASWTLIAVSFLWILASWLLILLQCGTDLDYLWGSSNGLRAHCLLGVPVVIPTAAIDVFIDLCILLLPIVLIWQLHMILWKKFATSIIFVFGGLAIAASIVRLVKYSQLYFGQQKDEFKDEFQVNSSIVYWSLFEGGVAIIPACLPTLGPLISEDFGNSLSRQLQNAWYQLTTFGGSSDSSRGRSTYAASLGRNNSDVLGPLPGKHDPLPTRPSRAHLRNGNTNGNGGVNGLHKTATADGGDDDVELGAYPHPHPPRDDEIGVAREFPPSDSDSRRPSVA